MLCCMRNRLTDMAIWLIGCVDGWMNPSLVNISSRVSKEATGSQRQKLLSGERGERSDRDLQGKERGANQPARNRTGVTRLSSQ